MKSFTVEQYLAAGCSEMKKESMLAVHAMTGGRVCDTGCHAFGHCKEHRVLIGAAVAEKVYTETVREEVERTGLTIGQVRRNRRDGVS